MLRIQYWRWWKRVYFQLFHPKKWRQMVAWDKKYRIHNPQYKGWGTPKEGE